MDQHWVIRRRVIGCEDLLLIRQLIEREGAQGRSHLSNRLCEIWDWRQANGRFRQIACRDLLRRLEARGLIALPARLSGVRGAGLSQSNTDACLTKLRPAAECARRVA